MGCDGGTIPKRDELVRTKKKAEEKDKTSVQLYRWRNCHLTQEALRAPIVACGLGLLYNKESVLQYLVNKTPFPEASAHIKSIKDVKVLKFTKNPAYKGEAQSVGGYSDDKCSPYICPIIGLEMNDRTDFVFSWKCGCVVSQRGMNFGADYKCVNCIMQYEEIDLVKLNPSVYEIPLMKTNIDERKAAIIKKKNMKKEPVDDFDYDMPLVIKIEEKDMVNFYPDYEREEFLERQRNYVEYKPIICKPVELVLKKPKRKVESAAGSSSSTNCRKLEDPVYKKAKLTHSIANDDSATNVYKSLFTSHEDDQTQTRAHWITYNPFYN